MLNQRQLNIIIKAQDEASKVFDKVGGRLSNLTTKAITFAKRAAKVITAAFVAGGIAASKAALDQVRSVQQATVALRAYEKDGEKVNAVLKDLVNYARSDLGVLFQREDLFKAAQGLKVMGAETENLSDYVQIMSRSVGLGMSNWDDLGRIIGRVGSTGRLTGIDFDNLTKAGFQLDGSIRNTNMTWEELFEHLDKGIPIDALQGQANTIDGQMTRLRSAFRDLGGAILGVNEDMDGFIEGSLGDRFLKAMDRLREAFRSEALVGSIRYFSELISNNVIPALGGMTRSILEAGRRAFDYLQPKLIDLWHVVRDDLVPALQRLWRDALQPLLPVIGGALVVALGLAIDAFRIILQVITPVINFLANHEWVLWSFISALVALKVALMLKGAYVAFSGVMAGVTGVMAAMSGTTIPRLLARFGLLKAAVIAPLAMPALVIAAPILALGNLVWAVRRAKATIDEIMNNARAKIDATSAAATNAARNVNANPTPANQEAFRQAARADFMMRNEQAGLTGRNASGTNFAPGGRALVGEFGPEIVDLPRGSKVHSNKQSEQMLGGATFNMYGSINLGDNSAVDRFFDRLNAQQEMSALGVGI